MSARVLLDNEAVQALGSPRHPKHRRVLAHVQVIAQRKRRAVQTGISVPTTVRVEAGWDRNSASWSFANLLRITDEPLDTAQANTAASIRQGSEVSVADAHLGAVIRSAGADRVAVITSDPADVRAVAGDRAVTVVTI